MQKSPLSRLVPRIVFLVLITISPNVTQAGPPDAWYHRMMPLYGVTCGQGLFVAVGDWGTILTSPDGSNWGAPSPYATFKNLRGVTYGAGLFVAVGENGVIITSSDGFQWTVRASQVSDLLWGITYGNGLFVAAGSLGTIVTSPNGVNWTKQNSKISEYLYGVAYGNGKFVAVGNSGRILTSSDGVEWAPQQVTSYELRGVAFGNNTFKAVGLAGTILSSDTGLSWSQTSLGVQYFFYNITYGDGMFMAVGEDVTHSGMFARYKGTSWEIGQLPEFPLYGVAIGNSTILLLGERGSIFRKNKVLDPLLDPEWLVISKGTTGYLNAVLPCNNQLIAAGYQINLISPNGVIWNPSVITSPVNYWSIASNGPNCVVVGDGGTILTTLDGNAWFSSNLGTSTFLFAVTYGGNGKFVAMGWSDKVYTSPDGKTWNDHPLGTTYVVTGVTYGNNKFVAVGLGGGVLTSPDGEGWNFTPSGVNQNLNGIAFGKGVFVAVGDAGMILTSSGGITWTQVANFPSSNNLYSVAFTGDSFFAVGAQGTIIFSEDGTHWSPHHSWTTKDLHGAAWARGYGVAVGADGTFLQSAINARLYLPLLLRN